MSRKRERARRIGLVMGAICPAIGCLGFAWAAGLGSAGGFVSILVLAVACPILGAARFGCDRGGIGGARRGEWRDCAMAYGVLAGGVAMAAVALCYGSIDVSALGVLIASLWLLLGFGWGLASVFARCRLPGVAAIVVAAVLSVASAGMPFWTDRMIAATPTENRTEFQATLVSLSTSLGLAAEVFDEQLLQKPWLYMQSRSVMAGSQVAPSVHWFGGWRLWCWVMMVVGGAVGLMAGFVGRRRGGG